jgi:hypothetical protein
MYLKHNPAGRDWPGHESLLAPSSPDSGQKCLATGLLSRCSDLISNRAYKVMSALACNLKSWIKEAIVRFGGHMNKKLVGESMAEFDCLNALA